MMKNLPTIKFFLIFAIELLFHCHPLLLPTANIGRIKERIFNTIMLKLNVKSVHHRKMQIDTC